MSFNTRRERVLQQGKQRQMLTSDRVPLGTEGSDGDIRIAKTTEGTRLLVKSGSEWLGTPPLITLTNKANTNEIEHSFVTKLKDKNNDEAITLDADMTIHKPLILNSTLSVAGAVTLPTLTTLTVDDITINGSTISDSGNFTIDVGGDITLDAAGGDITGALNGAAFFNCNYYRNRIGYHEGTTDGSGNIYVVFDSGDYDSRYGLFMYQKKTENSVWGLFAVYIDGSGGFTFVDVKDKDDHLTLTQQAVYEMKIAIDTGGDDRPVILLQLGGGLRVTAMNTTT